MKTKIIEGIIISIILLFMAYAVCGCKNEQPLSELHWDVIIEEKRAEGYYISTITMKKKFGFDETEAREPNEPEITFELTPYTTPPTTKGAIWTDSENMPPPSMFYYDGNKTIEYIPRSELNEPIKIR